MLSSKIIATTIIITIAIVIINIVVTLSYKTNNVLKPIGFTILDETSMVTFRMEKNTK